MNNNPRNDYNYIILIIVGILVLGLSWIFIFSNDSENDRTTTTTPISSSSSASDISLAQRPTQRTIEPPTTDNNQSTCLTADQSWSHVGKQGCVRFFVANPSQSSQGNVFLNERRDYRNGFTAVIFANTGLTSGAVSNYGNRTIEVSGLISKYEGHPQIIINNLSQIQVIE